MRLCWLRSVNHNIYTESMLTLIFLCDIITLIRWVGHPRFMIIMGLFSWIDFVPYARIHALIYTNKLPKWKTKRSIDIFIKCWSRIIRLGVAETRNIIKIYARQPKLKRISTNLSQWLEMPAIMKSRCGKLQ